MNDAQDLIDRLCVMAAMIMEDESNAALTTSVSTADLHRLIRSGRQVAALAEAALVIAARRLSHERTERSSKADSQRT